MADAGSLNENIAADGNSTGVTWGGGAGVGAAYGTFGGGTLTLNYSFDEFTTEMSVGTDTTITADGGGGFRLPHGTRIRWVLSGATGADIDLIIAPAHDRPRR